MTTLVTGGNGFLANRLKQYIDGDFLGKDQLDLTNINCINNLPHYDILIHTATGSVNIGLNFERLLEVVQPNKIFVFTSKQGTFLNWKKPGHLNYGLEKLILNFTVYRHNLTKHNAQLVEPGHMETQEHYDFIAEKFSNYYKKWKITKNMVYDLVNERYLPY